MSVMHLLGDSPRIFSVAPNTTLKRAAAMLREENLGALLVLDQTGVLLGIISERDIARAVSGEKDPREVLVGEVMTSEVVKGNPHTSISQAYKLMSEGGFRHLPILTPSGSVCGIISIRDVARAQNVMLQAELEQLADYVGYSPTTATS